MQRNCLDKKTLKQIKFSRRIVDNKPLNRESFNNYYKALKQLRENKEDTSAMKFVQVTRYLLKQKEIIRYYFEMENNPEIETYYTFIDDRTKKTCANYVFSRLKEKMQMYRNKSRELIKIDGKVGLVRLNFGDLKMKATDELIDSCFNPKSPRTEDNYLGIEIECYTPHDHHFVARKFVQERLHKYICLKEDGSINPPNSDNYDDSYCDDCGSESCDCFDRYSNNEYRDLEVNILVKESEVTKIIPKICKVLIDLDADVNRTCGLHVHLDCRNRNHRIVFTNLVRFQKYLLTLIAPHRIGNYYCYINDNDCYDTCEREHYRGISGKHSYLKYRTMEVRLHESTLDSTKILNWINVLLSIANRQKRARNLDRDNVKQLKRRLRLRKVG